MYIRIPSAFVVTRTLLAQGQLVVPQDLQVLLNRTTFQHVGPYPVLVHQVLTTCRTLNCFCWVSKGSVLPIPAVHEILLKVCAALWGYWPLLSSFCPQQVSRGGTLIPSSRLMDKLSNTGSSINPWGTPLVTGLQLDYDADKNPEPCYSASFPSTSLSTFPACRF